MFASVTSCADHFQIDVHLTISEESWELNVMSIIILRVYKTYYLKNTIVFFIED